MIRLFCMLICCVPFLAVAADQPLGRLFMTPAERAALDVIRQNSKPPEKIVTPSDGEDDGTIAESAPAVIPPVVTIHGYVKRSDGKGTVWVNGQPVQEKSATKEIEVGRMQGNTDQVQIKLPSTGQTVRLKAGQSYDPASGKMADSVRDLPQRQEETAPATPKQEKGKNSKAPAASENPDAKPALPPATPSN